MNELQVFKNDMYGEIRTVTIDNEPYFVGKDVVEALGYANSRKALGDHVDGEDKRESQIVTPGGTQNMVIINESGLYSLILSSKLPTAKQFKRWVTNEVLPTIRKHGGYIAGQEHMSEAELMAKALLVAQSTLQQRDQRIKSLEAEKSALIVENTIMQPKADYFDELVDRNLLTNFTEAAKQLGVKRKDLIDFMLAKKYLYRDKKGNLLPYANKKASGLFDVKESFNQKTQWTGCQTLLTPKGMETFRLLCAGL